MTETDFNRGMLKFIQASPTPFHAVATMEQALQEANFQRLRLQDKWQLQAGGRYFVSRNGSSILAFVFGKTSLEESGLRMVGAHTDSPCLKVKPRPVLKNQGYYQLGVEVYGGVLLNPWFDRDLSLAGRVTYQHKNGGLASTLIDFQRPVAIIPSLAIHLDRNVNDERKINPQTDVPPVMMLAAEEADIPFEQLLADELARHTPGGSKHILDWELYFYDTQPPAVIGLRDEFIASARLDNLASCYIGLEALKVAPDQVTSVLICNDHEEVGSQSAAGAQGPFLKDVLHRLVPDTESRSRALERSVLISTDNAHGVHPNFPDKHDANHGPLLNGGPVIKVNANQRYASNSETGALFQALAREAGVPVQNFVSRADMGCGSTIGPLTATVIGVRTLDVGIPTFAMHSIRELAGTKDAWGLYQVLARLFHQNTLNLPAA